MMFLWFFLFWLLLSFQIQTGTSIQVFNYQIRDLQQATFTNDALDWTVSGKRISTWGDYNSCGGYYLYGGPGILGNPGTQNNYYIERVYQNLPPHTMINIAFNMWVFDTWDGETVQIWIDGKTFYSAYFSSAYLIYEYGCGYSNYRFTSSIGIYGRVQHISQSVTIRLYPQLNSNSADESMGIQDFQVLFNGNPAAADLVCTTTGVSVTNVGSGLCTGSSCDSACGYCYGSGPSNCFSCRNVPNVFYDGYSCQYCHAYCNTCYGVNSNQCTSCAPGYYFFAWANQCLPRCDYPLYYSGATCLSICPSAASWIYWDGSCQASCNFPFQQMTILSVLKVCVNPCSAVEFLYWDGSCRQDCESPMSISTTRGVKLCSNGCASPRWLSYTGTCVTTCDPPLIERQKNRRFICHRPCPVPQFYYWTGECMDSCTPLLTSSTSASINYCNFPCPTNQYLYWNTSCLDTCPYPLHTRIERKRLYCDFPTNTANYLYWDGSEELTCVSPATPRVEGSPMVRYYCDYGCDHLDYLYWDGSCEGECLFPLTQRITKSRQFCDFVCGGATPYLYWNGSCLGSCIFPLDDRGTKGRDFCDYLCEIEEFLYWQGSCEQNCPPLLTTRVEGWPMQRNFCDFPCMGSFLYQDGTCETDCPSPDFFTVPEHGQFYCNFTCPDGTFLYYNGSCLPFCYTPFVTRTFRTGKYCDLPCLTTEFYYWNGTCEGTCDKPLRQYIVGDLKWCIFACLDNQFVHINYSCSDTCNLPLSVKEEDGRKYCLNPCDPTLEFLSWDGTCKTTCYPPLRNGTENFGKVCMQPCENPTDFYYEDTAECKPTCDTPSLDHSDIYLRCFPPKEIIDYGAILDILLETNNTEENPTLVAPVKMLNYIRYLDIILPPRLERFVAKQRRSFTFLRFGKSMSESMASTFPKRSIPDIFEKRGLHSNFLVNFWGEIMSWMIVVGATLIFQIIQGIFALAHQPEWKLFMKKLKVLTKWNFLLILISTSVPDIILYSFLEFESLGDLGQSFSAIGFCATLIALLLTSVLMFMIIRIVKTSFTLQIIAKETRSNDEYEKFLIKWKGYQIFFRGFNYETNPNQLFFLFYLIRICLPMVFSAYLFYSAMTQVILNLLLSVTTLVYIHKKHPLAKKLNHLQLLMIEIIVLFINSCLFILKLCETTDIQDTHTAVLLGDFIISGNALINALLIIFLFIKLYECVKAVYRYQIRQHVKRNSMWLQPLVCILQQGGMGFEEVYVDLTAASLFNQSKYLISNDKEQEELDLQLKHKTKWVMNPTPVGEETPIAVAAAAAEQQQFESDLVSFRPVPAGVIQEARRDEVSSNNLPVAGNPVNRSVNYRKPGLDSTMQLFLNDSSFIGVGYNGTPLAENRLFGDSFQRNNHHDDDGNGNLSDLDLSKDHVIFDGNISVINGDNSGGIFDNRSAKIHTTEEEPPQKRGQMKIEDEMQAASDDE